MTMNVLNCHHFQDSYISVDAHKYMSLIEAFNKYPNLLYIYR